MAKSQYNGDSPFPPLLSEHPGTSGSSEALPAPFPALPAIVAPFMPTLYILKDGAAVYIGETTDFSGRSRDRIAAVAAPRENEPSPTTATPIN